VSTTKRPTQMPPASRLFSRLLGCVLVCWFLAYNGLRISGDSPRGAAWISLAIGAAAGIVIFAASVAIGRALAARGRVVYRSGPVELPSPDAMDDGQRDALRLAAIALGVLAAVALVVGLLVGADWIGSSGGLRNHLTKLILTAWDLLIAIWLAIEVPRLMRYHGESLDSIPLACSLTAVLAGVAYSRNLVEPGQIVLIVVAGLAGAAAAFATWRLSGAQGPPIAPLVPIAVAALSIILPIVI
jgi:hypothetical protein